MAGNIIPVAPGTATITATYGALTTTIPVTVSAAPPPSLPQPSGLAFESDDFVAYANTAALQARIATIAGGTGTGSVLYDDGAHGDLAFIDQTITYNGHQTCGYGFPGNNAIQPELWPLFTPRNNIWYRSMIRFVPGFTTAGNGSGASGANAYKLLGWTINTGLYDGSGRIEITNTTQYVCYWGASNKTTGATVINTDTSGKSPGNITTEWTDGAWYSYIFNYYVSGTTSFCNVYLGRNAETPTLRSQGSAPNLDGLAAPPAGGVCCGLNYNRVRSGSQAFQINYGFWEVCDGTLYPNPYGVVLP